MKFLVRNIHKYLSFLISIQLLLWTVSGIYFAFNKIENVRGEQYREEPNFNVDFSKLNFQIEGAQNIRVIDRMDQEILVVDGIYGREYLNFEGRDVEQLKVEEAKALSAKQTSLIPESVDLITENTIGSEYRGRALPIYRVKSVNEAGESINVYLNIYTGEVEAVRSNQWRIWDLMWGFHIMDWETREDIDNLLLKIFSILALISSITGVLLFFKVDIRNKV
ncbi:MAG: PepSY domain-containing protein [SAR86 cluster bacterium]|uniref:PepSY domain-containing protein n=1 Tax=SAR86 cluster bacterium TaxID=2030880 RepID=A0A937IHF5_9GAMM|nr:PepSY domain-containing protein [SAR86 cluster bacterium]